MNTLQEVQPAEAEFRELWLLLLKDRRLLTQEEITRLLSCTESIRRKSYEIWRWFPEEWEKVIKYRTRKTELEKLSTEKLQETWELIGIEGARIHAQYDGRDDDLPDSFFEGPGFDSDENIVYELLKERKAPV